MDEILMLPEPSIEALAEEMVRKQLKDYKVTMLAELIGLENEAKKNLEERLDYLKQKKDMVMNMTIVPNYSRCEPCYPTTSPCRG